MVKSVPTLAAEVLRGIQREAVSKSAGDMLIVKLNPEVARYLYDHGAKDLETLEQRLETKIVLRSNDTIDLGAFELARAPAAA